MIVRSASQISLQLSHQKSSWQPLEHCKSLAKKLWFPVQGPTPMSYDFFVSARCSKRCDKMVDDGSTK